MATRRNSTLNHKADTTSNLATWMNNATVLTGQSPDVIESVGFARKFVKNNPGAEITMVGHSKGGGEAMFNAIATDTINLKFPAGYS